MGLGCALITSCRPLHERPFEVFRLIFAYAPATVMPLAFLHDPLPDWLSDKFWSAPGLALGRFGSRGNVWA